LESEKRTLEKIKNDQESQIKQLKEDKDYFIKMNHFEEDIKKYKKELKEQRMGQVEDQRNMKEVQERLVLIFHQYRDVCQKAGISGSLNLTTAVNSNKIMKR